MNRTRGSIFYELYASCLSVAFIICFDPLRQRLYKKLCFVNDVFFV